MRIVVKDLGPGRTYNLQFRSKSAEGESVWSPTFPITISTQTSKPVAPTGVVLESVGDSFQARWNRVTMSDDGSLATDLTGYVVQFRNVNTNQTATFETTDTSFELTFNLNFAMFTPLAGQVGVKVAAKNNMGIQGDWSAEVITQNPPPGPVRNLVAEGVIDAISATWEPPENLEDDFKEYRAFVGTSENFTPTTPVWTGVGTSAIYYTSTKVNHWVKVIAYDKFLSPSTVVTAGPVMPRSSVEVDVDAPATPTNLDGSISGQRLTVTWTAPANPDNDLAGYQIGYRPVGQTGWSYATASHEDTSVVIEPVTRFVNYETKIQAHDFSFNYSPWSAIDTVTGEVNTPPAAPTGVQVKGAITSAMVLWNANTEEDLAGYEVQFEQATPVDGDEVYATPGRTMSFSENVTENTTYYSRVRAVDTQGLKSAWSAVATGTVGFVPEVELSDGNAPASSPTPKITAGVDALYVQWPAITNNDPVTYEVYISTTSGFTPGSTTKFAELDGTALAIRTLANGTTALAQNTTYYVRIIAKDVDGAAPAGTQASAQLRKIVIGDTTNVRTDGVKPASSPVATLRAGVGSIFAQWNAVANVDPVTYEVHIGTTTGFTPAAGTKVGETASTFNTIQKLPDGSPLAYDTNYYVRLIAKDADGAAVAGAASNAAAIEYVPTQGDLDAIDTRLDDTIIDTTVQYAVNTSETVAPTSGWSSATPTRNPGDYIWFRTVITYSDGSGATSNAALLTGNDGAQGEQGIPGTPGDDGQSLYTWLKYADTPTSGMSDSPTGKTYIGLAYNKTTPTESTTYSDYSWSLIKGADGADGDQGIQGPPGADGESLYTWVKYAPNGNPTQAQMSDSPTGMTHIGLAYNKTVQTESNTPTDYTWALIQGPKGDTGDQGPQGIQGPPGEDGTERFTWIKYADSPTTGMADTPTGKTYMGIAYNKTTATESSNYSDYSWSLIKGADGSDGKGISNTVVNYTKSTNGTTAPTTGWGTAIPTTVAGEYLWTRTETTYTDASKSTAYSVARHGATGSTGATGRGITGTTVTYQKSTSGTVQPSTWLTSIPATNPGEFLWTKTTTTYSSAPTSVDSFSVAKHGETGQQGIQGPPGDDGQTTYTWIRYADTETGGGISNLPDGKKYIGIAYNKTTATESNTAGDYQWSLIQGPKGDTGDQGPQGIQGPKGDDGVQLYTWLKYADTPTTGMSDSPTGKTYMGVAYNKTTATESSNYGDYQWSLIKGADGAAGADGKGISNTSVTYAKNTSGTAWPSSGWAGTIPSTSPGEFLWTRTITTYTDNSNSTAYSVAKHGSTGATGATGVGITGTTVTYQKSASGTVEPSTWLSSIPATAPGEYLWTKTVTSYSNSTSSTAYSVAKHGETGSQGIQGPPGDDGQPTYTWIKYADSSSGAGMSDSPTGKTYIGIAYNKLTQTESSTAGDYTWSLIQGPKGDKGDTGNTGATGVSVTAVTPFYRKVTKGAAQPGQPSGTANPSGWTTTEPSYTENTELYRTERISYSNNTAAWTPVTKVASYDAAAAAMTVAITADNRVRKANVAPVVADGANAPVGALWYEYGAATAPGTGTVLKQTYEWTGSTWQPRGIDRTFLPAVDIATGTFGDLTGARLVANTVKSAQIDTAELTANSAFIDSLKVNAANVQGTLTIGQLPSTVATTTNYGYTYKKSIILNGDSDKFYPVVIMQGDQTVKRDILVKRGYSEQAPPDWNTSTHKGGLTLKIKTNFGGWGGAQYSWEVHELEQMYAPTFGGAMNVASNMGFAIFLRGGGTTGAIYHIYSDQPIEGVHTLFEPDQEYPVVFYNGETINAVSGTNTYPQKMPDPRPHPLPAQYEEEIRDRKFIALAQDTAALTDGWKMTGKTTINGGAIETDTVKAAQIDVNNLVANTAWVDTFVSSAAFIDNAQIKSANITGTLTIGQLPNTVAETSDVTAAKNEAISTAAGDATTKANNAKTAAVTEAGTAADGKVSAAVNPINTLLNNWQAGSGTTYINGGIILTDSIGAGSIRTEEIAADQAFLNALTVTNANITSLEASKLTAGNGLITNLTVKSTLTIGDASNTGYIQSSNFSGTTAGWRLDKSGLTINQGTIEARTLKIQTGQNLLKPEFADFELPDSFYNSSNLTIVGNVTTTAVAGGRFNKQKLQVRADGFNTQEVYFGTSTSDYNIPVEGGKNYIVSAYVAGSTLPSNFSMRVRWSNGAYTSYLASTSVAASSAFQRVSAMVTAPAGVTGAILSVYGSSTLNNSGWDIDGLQFEEQFGALSTPSPWTPPGVSVIDGGMIRTGEIRSNTNISLPGAGTQPMWSLNMAGGMQVNSAVIRGNLTVGAGTGDSGAVIQSHNYVAGVSGFVMRGSDGFAEFQNLLVNLNSTTPGQIIVGTLEQGGQTIITGGPGGGVKFFIPEAESAVAEFGRNVLARNAEGETVASMGDDGVVSGQTGIFENLTVAGKDVTESVTRDDTQVLVMDDTGIVATTYGPYSSETGFREVGFYAEPDRIYKVENWVHIVNLSTVGSFIAYLRYSSANTGAVPSPPTVSSTEISSNDASPAANAEARIFNSGYITGGTTGANIRLLISARGTGARNFRFVRSRFSVTDLGTYDPLVTSGRFSLGGASGAPAPDPTPPPQLYKKWYDFSWEEVYQISGAAAHGSGGLGSKARMGRVGSTSNYPWGTMLGLPSALVSDLSGATVKKAGIRLTSLSWMDGAVISGYATASSAPANMPTTPSGASNIGTLPKGATKTLWLPSSYYTTLKTSSRALTLGRLNSSGYNDTFIETANISAASQVRPRLYVEYEK